MCEGQHLISVIAPWQAAKHHLVKLKSFFSSLLLMRNNLIKVPMWQHPHCGSHIVHKLTKIFSFCHNCSFMDAPDSLKTIQLGGFQDRSVRFQTSLSVIKLPYKVT